MDKPDRRALFPIGVVEQLTGLTARQIRYYETNGLILPERTEGRQRLYTESDVERLKEIKALMGRGMTLGNVKSYFERRAVKLPQVRAATKEPPRPPEHSAMDAPNRLGKEMHLTSVYPVSNRAVLERMIDRDKSQGQR